MKIDDIQALVTHEAEMARIDHQRERSYYTEGALDAWIRVGHLLGLAIAGAPPHDERLHPHRLRARREALGLDCRWAAAMLNGLRIGHGPGGDDGDTDMQRRIAEADFGDGEWHSYHDAYLHALRSAYDAAIAAEERARHGEAA